MNSRVIKCVAGAGKTRWSKDYVKTNGNGLYLAFTNSVVDELSSCGVISRTTSSGLAERNMSVTFFLERKIQSCSA